jgi:hypothetical protein
MVHREDAVLVEQLVAIETFHSTEFVVLHRPSNAGKRPWSSVRRLRDVDLLIGSPAGVQDPPEDA